MDVGRMESMSFKDKLIQDWGLSSARNNKVVEGDDIEIKDEGVITGLDSLKHTVVGVDENFNLNITVREENESRLVMQSNRKNDNTPSVRMMPPDPRDPKMDSCLTSGEGSEVSPRLKENGWVCKTLYPTRIIGFEYLILQYINT
ncbi:hypothetical protein PVK06_046729 [Gossypium arboreum]|uniref:Uncharacterized protein n=1 Tax=Gossypium arboreum TaxID=29729 RepID=A0ABR0MBJ6_GOSAR|nr:hypothetical protein PVK06_046729 [Gossypium arboreum]